MSASPDISSVRRITPFVEWLDLALFQDRADHSSSFVIHEDDKNIVPARGSGVQSDDLYLGVLPPQKARAVVNPANSS